MSLSRLVWPPGWPGGALSWTAPAVLLASTLLAIELLVQLPFLGFSSLQLIFGAVAIGMAIVGLLAESGLVAARAPGNTVAERPSATLGFRHASATMKRHRALDQDRRRMKTLLEGGASTACSDTSRLPPIVRVPVPDLCALWAETTTALMNIALIGVVEEEPLLASDGAVALDRIRSFIEIRLPRAPAPAYLETHPPRPRYAGMDRCP